MLIDCGDTIQGSPLESVYQAMVRTGHGPPGLPAPAGELRHDPMMLAMNRLGYAAMAVGNHEYNFGLGNLGRARGDADFPWLSANTEVAPGGREQPFAPYIVATVAGVKVAVIGITTPAVPTWEKPENYGAYRFTSAPDAVGRAVAKLRAGERPDLILVAAHSGLGRDLRTGEPDGPGENVVYAVASAVPEIDAIVFGHTHQRLEGARIGSVLVVQPKNAGASLARIDFTLERNAGQPWKLTDKRSRLLPATAATPAAADILEIARPYHELAERYLELPVANARRSLDAGLGRVEDTALLDAVQTVQLYYSHADVSFTALFTPQLTVPMGPVTVRQIAALYPYENELYLIQGDGKMVKEALENAARYFRSCADEHCGPPLVNDRVMGFNYDVAEGVEYEIDLTRPAGDRIRNLRWQGKPLSPSQPLKLAVNNYRAAGSAGYSMFKGAKILWQSGEEIRDMIIRYYTGRKELPVEPDNNWRVVPEAARRTLEKQAAEYSRRPDAL